MRVGFRPFFLGAGLWSAGAMALWLAQIGDVVVLPSAFEPVVWHAHEMLFGYLAAAVSGFLLTAIPNWTGRLPVRDRQLGLLFALWAAGRLAVAGSALIGAGPAAVIDLAFPSAFAAVMLREILAGGNRRNLPVAGIMTVLVLSNLLTHLEALGVAPTASLGLRLGLADVAVLMTLVGGRVVPSFTRNWLAKRGEAAAPRPFGRIDRLAMAAAVAAGLAWAVMPEAGAAGALALLAAAAGAARLAGWRGQRTLSEPLVWVLHLGYAWLVVGFAFIAAAILVPGFGQTAALHALTAGAMGTMPLAIMTRATLGHTGRELTAGPGTTAIYALVTGAAVLRVLAALSATNWLTLIGLSALAWIAAFALFVGLYAPLLVRPRRA